MRGWLLLVLPGPLLSFLATPQHRLPVPLTARVPERTSERTSERTTGRASERTSERTSKRAGAEAQDAGVRLNKCLPSLSRRGADAAIEAGRVTVNGRPAGFGVKVRPGDKVCLDGRPQRWEGLAKAMKVQAATVLEERRFVYLKYWKPVGVTSTSDPKDASNIIAAGGFHLFPQRLFTVGRLDKDSTGLILLTSDGRVNNALLSRAERKEKIYEVTLNRVPSDAQVRQLASGVTITTTSQRDGGGSREVTRPTLPCNVTRIGRTLIPPFDVSIMTRRWP